jgi:hypothetical protein
MLIHDGAAMSKSETRRAGRRLRGQTGFVYGPDERTGFRVKTTQNLVARRRVNWLHCCSVS